MTTTINYEALLAEQQAAWLAIADAELEAAHQPIETTGSPVLDLSLQELREKRLAIATKARQLLLALHEKQRADLQQALQSGLLE